LSVLLIDNYDSFTFNLYQQLAGLGAEVSVARNDQIDLDAVDRLDPEAIVLSPGPGHPDRPRDFGICAEVLRVRADRCPILGVCLGHQGIVHHFGGRIGHAPEVVHGKSSRIEHTGAGIFAGIETRPEVMRYHSLVAEESSIPACLEITARSVGDGLVMAVCHRELPVHGLQFHPESIGTEVGDEILRNFLELR
jgi:anthranilate synthase/aminodeoxychorismate synthase-like glutamine amidotransferase